ncbi:MAG: hypothetical protein HZB87_07480 [Desulfatitalea sp.]|nr:hypothetical protein [Desulfatitalea sp.]
MRIFLSAQPPSVPQPPLDELLEEALEELEELLEESQPGKADNNDNPKTPPHPIFKDLTKNSLRSIWISCFGSFFMLSSPSWWVQRHSLAR